MKHIMQLALLGTVALVAAGCQREMVQKVADNPTYNAKTGDVTTQFVLSVSTETGSTKQTADVVQANGQAFRGMRGVHMLIYHLDSEDNGTNKKGDEFFLYDVSAAGRAARDYDMGSMLAKNEISAEQSSRVLELSLPLKSNAMLLYALPQKPDQGSMSIVDYNNKYGAVTAGVVKANGSLDTESNAGFSTDLSKARFELVNRLTNQAAFTGFGWMMGDMMTGFIRTECTGNRTYAYWWPQDSESKTWSTRTNNSESGVVFTGSEIPTRPGYAYKTGTASWAQMGHVYKINHDDDQTNDQPQSYLQEALGEAYYQLVNIKGLGTNKQELRAGSSASILRTLRDLYDVLVRVQNATVSEEEDQVAKEVAKEIVYRLKKFFNIENGTLEYKDIQEMKAAISTIYENDMNTTFEARCGNIELNSSFLCDNQTYEGGFPLNLGLPMSTALLSTLDLNDGKGLIFYYLDYVPAYGMDMDGVPITYYRYPPELMYWANSGLRTSDLVHSKQDYPHTVSAWATSASPSNDYWKTTRLEGNESVPDWKDNSEVSSTTRSVAVMKQVNYGVALLEAHTMYASNLPDSGGKKYVEDNNGGIHPGEENNKIYIDGNSFHITGIIIGGVCDRVGWDYCSIAANNEDGNIHNKLIYDYVGENVIPTTGDVTTYTTTWDSYLPKVDNQGSYTGAVGTQADQHDVYLAVELKNNSGKDIWGELNLIRDGGTFYLVGKMDLADAMAACNISDEDFWPKNQEYHYPPFDPANGNTVKVKRVFMQDYTTVANLRFGKNSLSHAYVTVPDLRASQVSLGLSVDIQWRQGLTFDVDLGSMD